MRVVCALAILLLSIVAAEAKSFSLTLANQIALLDALKQLDFYERTIKEAGGTERVMRESYKFSSTVRFNVAKAIAAIAVNVEAYNKARQAAFMAAANGKSLLKQGDAELAAFQDQDLKLLQNVVPVELEPLKVEDLDLEHNAIPGSVLASLLLIKGD